MFKLEILKRITLGWFLFFIFSISFLSYHLFKLFNLGPIKILELKKLNSDEIFIKIKLDPNIRLFIDEREYIRDENDIISAKIHYQNQKHLEIVLKNDIGIYRKQKVLLNF